MTKKQRLGYYAYLALFTPFALLPLSVLHFIARGIAFLLYKGFHYREKVVRGNLEASFPGITEAELQTILRGFYQNVADVMVEAIKLLHISQKELDRRVTVKGQEHVYKHWKEGRPIILLLGHTTNWEWVPYISIEFMPDLPCRHIYRVQDDLAFQGVMDKIRGRFPSIGVTQEGALREMVKLRRDNGVFMIGVIGDHRPVVRNGVKVTEFMNQQTVFSTAMENLGHRMGAAYLYVQAERTSRGHYTLTYIPIEPSEELMAQGHEGYPYTRQFYRMLEATLRRNPSNWLWSHRRWAW